MLAGVAVGLMAFAWHLSIAVVFVLLVGIAAGMAFLSGTTLLGGEVADEVRGRVFGFVNMATRVVLMLAIALSSVLVGLGDDRGSADRQPVGPDLDDADPAAGGRRGRRPRRHRRVPADGRQARRAGPGRPVEFAARPPARPARSSAVRRGVFIVFEGGEGSGKSTQVDLLAAALVGDGREVVVTREPGATEVGARIRSLLLDRAGRAPAPAGVVLAPRAEALLYAADRAHHVASGGPPGAGPGRGRDQRPLHRLVPGLPGRRPDPAGRGGLLAVGLGDRRAEAGPGGAARHRPGGRAGPGSRRGAADRLEARVARFHERVRYAFLDLAAADPRRYLVLDATARRRVAAAVAERVRRCCPPVPTHAAPATGPTAAPDRRAGAAGGRPTSTPRSAGTPSTGLDGPGDRATGRGRPGTPDLASILDRRP